MDHRSLKYLLEQQITTLDQQRWIVKLMWYDYEIKYRPGWENKAADALLRLHGDLATISCPWPTWLDEIHYEARHDPSLVDLRDAIKRGEAAIQKISDKEGLLWYQGRLVLPAGSRHKTNFINEFHDTPIGGHSGALLTYKRVAANFYWVGMKRDILEYVWHYDVCQRSEYDSQTPGGLLQLLPIPDRVWEDGSIDFIKGLPSSNGYSVVLVVVDRLSK